MYQISLNRWMVAGLVALGLIFGNDLVAPVMKAIGILTSVYVPAV